MTLYKSEHCGFSMDTNFFESIFFNVLLPVDFDFDKFHGSCANYFISLSSRFSVCMRICISMCS